jgi:NADP-dependent 3-hydroxy acid dehydrogenase YdfG
VLKINIFGLIFPQTTIQSGEKLSSFEGYGGAKQRFVSFGHFVNLASTAAYLVFPNMSVYCGTKFAVRAISEGLRQEVGDKLRVTIISPGMTRTNFAETMTHPQVKVQLQERADKTAMPPDAIARAIAFAIEQPADIDVNEIVVRPTVQG